MSLANPAEQTISRKQIEEAAYKILHHLKTAAASGDKEAMRLIQEALRA